MCCVYKFFSQLNFLSKFLSLLQNVFQSKNYKHDHCYKIHFKLKLAFENIAMFIFTNVACAVGPSVMTSSIDFSFLNLVFLEFIWFFNGRNHPHSKSKSYQINSIKSDSSRPFQQHQRHIPILPKFSWNQAHPPLIIKSFSKNIDLKHLGSMDLITIKQNKTNYLPS
jgi:hypothetical protein